MTRNALSTPAGFDAWYEESFDRLVRSLAGRIGDREEAHDCVQEAFVRAWAHRDELVAVAAPDAWVRVTAYRLAVSRWRRASVRRRRPDRAVSPGVTTPGPTADHVALVDALAQLPPAQARALVLVYVGDRPLAEVAEDLEVPLGTVKSWLSRGRRSLAAMLSADDEPAASPAPPLLRAG